MTRILFRSTLYSILVFNSLSVYLNSSSSMAVIFSNSKIVKLFLCLYSSISARCAAFPFQATAFFWLSPISTMHKGSLEGTTQMLMSNVAIQTSLGLQARPLISVTSVFPCSTEIKWSYVGKSNFSVLLKGCSHL